MTGHSQRILDDLAQQLGGTIHGITMTDGRRGACAYNALSRAATSILRRLRLTPSDAGHHRSNRRRSPAGRPSSQTPAGLQARIFRRSAREMGGRMAG